MATVDKKIAQEGFNGNGCRKGRSKQTRRIWRNSKRAAKAKAILIALGAE